MTDPTPNTHTPAPEAQSPLDELNFEANDHPRHAVEVAAIEAEMRALTGQALAPLGAHTSAVGNAALTSQNILRRGG